jgi:hypothetical protein
MAETNPFWWAQPLATLATGAAAIWAAIHTIHNHSVRLRNEQLERRAKERETALQDRYGEFAAAAEDAFNILFTLNTIDQNLTALKEVKRSSGPKPMDVDHELAENEADDRRYRQRIGDAFASLSAARSHITLLDDNPKRLDELRGLYDTVFSLRPPDVDRIEKEVQPQFRAFIDRTAAELVWEYQQAADLARKGVFPPIVIRPAPAVTKAVARGPAASRESDSER